MPALEQQILEKSLWFGSPDQPLFGRLTSPVSGMAKGGVLISPPIGRESRLARRALRSLAMYLAVDGYASLRFDHYGTGDSSGSMNDEFERAWLEGVDQGLALLRSLGIASVSAVGMRMGATIVGAAASAQNLGLTSFVMWDPCESGRTYMRELDALGAMRQHVLPADLRGSTRLLEYPLSDGAARRVRRFSLTGPTSGSVADRVLVVVRDDRTVSKKFRTRHESEGVEWRTTSEQGPLLETELPESLRPTLTIARIRAWLTTPETSASQLSDPPRSRDAVFMVKGPTAHPVRERAVELGTQRMFGIVSEPEHEVRGPLVVMVNGINEDHVGPSRLWVEMSRRWAGAGLRCLRFDLGELGESAWNPEGLDRSVIDKTLRYDVSDAVRALSPSDASDSVMIGLCSGAQLALESGLELGFRELCAINPQVGAPIVPTSEAARDRDPESALRAMSRMTSTLKRYKPIDYTTKLISRLVHFSAFSPKVKTALETHQSTMLLLLSPHDPSPFSGIPLVGSLLGRRLIASDRIDVKIIPGLDHDFLSILGRERAIAILDRHIVDTYASVASRRNAGSLTKD